MFHNCLENVSVNFIEYKIVFGISTSALGESIGQFHVAAMSSRSPFQCVGTHYDAFVDGTQYMKSGLSCSL